MICVLGHTADLTQPLNALMNPLSAAAWGSRPGAAGPEKKQVQKLCINTGVESGFHHNPFNKEGCRHGS